MWPLIKEFLIRKNTKQVKQVKETGVKLLKILQILDASGSSKGRCLFEYLYCQRNKEQHEKSGLNAIFFVCTQTYAPLCEKPIKSSMCMKYCTAGSKQIKLHMHIERLSAYRYANVFCKAYHNTAVL